MIDQNQREHRLPHRHEARQKTGIVAGPASSISVAPPGPVHRRLAARQAAGRLDRHPDDDRFAAADAAQHPSVPVGRGADLALPSARRGRCSRCRAARPPRSRCRIRSRRRRAARASPSPSRPSACRRPVRRGRAARSPRPSRRCRRLNRGPCGLPRSSESSARRPRERGSAPGWLRPVPA